MKKYERILGKFTSALFVICLIFNALITADIVSAEENGWVTEDITLPVALRGASIEYANNKMYVIGGDKKVLDMVDTLNIYDFNTGSWSFGAVLSKPKSFAQSVSVGNKIYYMGGREVINGTMVSTTEHEIYDIKTDTWTKGASLPLPTSETKAVEYQGKIYIFGGCQSYAANRIAFHQAIQIYDIKTNTWTVSESMDFQRYSFTLDVIEDKVYLFGGLSQNATHSDLKIYDITNDTWSDGASGSFETCSATSVNRNNKIYVCGGMVNGIETRDSLEIYDAVTDSWSSGANLTGDRCNGSSIIHEDRVYLVSGQTNGSNLTDSIESLQLPEAINHIYVHLYLNEETRMSLSHEIEDNENFIWKSSSPKVASVDDLGLVTAHEVGTTFISVYERNGNFIGYIPVLVTERDVYRLAVQINSGQSQKLTIKGNPTDVIWSSMDQNVASVNQNGLVTGVTRGLSVVKAEVNGTEQYIYVRVN